jgi:transcriptional regulator with XRE-family HTH domain
MPNSPRNLTRGQALRHVRMIYNVSQASVAALLGIHRPRISEWECGVIGISNTKWNTLVWHYPILNNMDVRRR